MMPGEPRLGLLRERRHLAASVPPSAADRLAGVGVYVLDLKLPEAHGVLSRLRVSAPQGAARAYRIRRFEVPASRANADAWLCEDDLLDKLDAIVFADEDLLVQLEELGVDAADLKVPGLVDYPI